ncbi:MAG: terminase family protein [Sandaracinaceae bacterium]
MTRLSAIERRKLQEYRERQARRFRLNLEQLTFGPQRDFVLDSAPYVAASCSRQCGKSYGIGLKLIDAGFEHPHAPLLYLTNTRPQARSIMWPVLHELHDTHRIGGTFHEVRQTYTLPNGAVIHLGGANDEVEIERYRGPQYAKVVIDEAQSIRPFIGYLINEIIRPGQAKYGDAGQILVTGTPNAARAGFLYDVATGVEEGWSVHKWTIRDNPHIPNPEKFIADILRRRGLTEKDAAYLREFCGEWVRDSASQVYQIRRQNLLEAFPDEPNDWRFVLGIDFGFVNITAYVVLAYSIQAGRIVVAESFQRRPRDEDGMLTPEEVAQVIEGLHERYGFVSMVGDPGGLGSKFIEALRKRFALPIKAAEKQAKLGAIELMNGDLRTRRMMVVEHANRDLLHDAANLQWNWAMVDAKKHGGNVLRSDLVIDDRTPDHLTDAATYGYRECRHFLYDDSPGDRHPPKGSAAYEDWLEEQRTEEELEEAEGDDWLTDGEGGDPFGLEW